MIKILLIFLLLTIKIFSDPIIRLNRNNFKEVKSFQPYVYGVKNKKILVLGSKSVINYLENNNINYEIVYKSENEYSIHKKSVISNENFIKYDEVNENINNLVNTYPNLIEKIIIGKSLEGRDIVGIKTISDKPKAKFRIVGGIHGDEAMSYQFVSDFMIYLIENNQNYNEIFNNAEIWIIPMLNPDGSVNINRRNSNNVDLNRNMGFFWKKIPYAGANYFSEPETKALQNLTLSENFTMSFSFHTYGDIINYVWNFSPDKVGDTREIINISSIYNSYTNYDVTEGYDWYQTTGDLNDYSYGTVGTLDWTIEMNDSDRDGSLFNNNKNALLKVLSTSKYGIEGFIYDENHIPLEAAIIVNDSLFYSNKNGYFYRYLLNGIYDIKVIAPNYKTYEATIEVSDNKPNIDIYMEREEEETLFAQKVISVVSLFKNSNEYIDVLLPKNLLFLPDENYFIMNTKGEILLKLPSRIEDKYLDLILRDYNNIKLTISGYESIDGEILFSQDYFDRDSLIKITPNISYIKIIEDSETSIAFIDSVLLKKIPDIPNDKDGKDYYSGSAFCDFNEKDSGNNFMLLALLLSLYIIIWRKKFEKE